MLLFPMQRGQGIIPVDLIMSPLLAPSTFSLWLPPYRTARITTLTAIQESTSPRRAATTAEGQIVSEAPHICTAKNLKAIYQWHSFSWKGSKKTQEPKTVKKFWTGNRKQEKQTKKIKLLLWKIFAFLERSKYRRGWGKFQVRVQNSH